MQYNWLKLGTTLVGALVTGIVGHEILPAGWDAAIMSVITAVAALHVEPPHK